MSIIDRRKNKQGKSAENRKRFLDRYKKQIKDSVEEASTDKELKDFFKKDNVKIKKKHTTEPRFKHLKDSGSSDNVHTGNKEYSKGDRIPKPQRGEGQGTQGSPDGEGEDDFQFSLTKEEFLNIYFDGMELPNFIKKSINEALDFKMKRAGYTNEGIPARLDIKKTFEQAMARKLASKARLEKEGRKPLYLTEEDVMYKNYEPDPQPVKHCVMFAIMDVSGSMGEHEKKLAKKYFLLLYLFLHKSYDSVEIRFIRHHSEAQEVNEHTFFYGRETGGTIVSKAFDLVNQIIDDEYDLSHTNVYIAQASDGDNWASNNLELEELLKSKILPKVQYMAYLEVIEQNRVEYRQEYARAFGGSPDAGLYDLYKKLECEKFQVRRATTEEEIYPVLRELFTKESK